MASRQLDEEAIFHIARQLTSADARATYLDQVCAGDASLRERVEALLRIHEQDQAFLNPDSPSPPPTADAASPTERPGTTIGRYRLMEQIGEGGMGMVFVAEQEKPIRRKVALKVIKPGMDSKAVAARFEAERQALAMMDHPNIAKVLDAGTTDSGRPFFAMELVRGIPITDYCDKNRLTIPERLSLFIQVCQAIQHAHQKGIIHRDIKPSNVLVTLHDGTPVPKVIDFGVAKALNTRLTDRTIYTEHLQVIGTLLYMSPEQAELSGLDIDTRSDVYSLGVVLYELLTGTTPFQKNDLDKAGLDEQRRIIRDQEPPRASIRISSLGATATVIAESRKTDPKRLHQMVRGDLDWIVTKALEKDRTRRYKTADALAMDVARLLADEPIEARPPSTAYRFRRFLRRNRAAVTAGCVIALVLLTSTVVAFSGWLIALRSEARLEQQNLELEIVSQEAKQNAATAQDALRQKQTAFLTLAQQSYARTMIAAFQAWETAGPTRARELLQEAQSLAAPSGTSDLAWRFLDTRCHEGRPSKVHFEKDTVCAAFAPDSKTIAAATRDGSVWLWNVRSDEPLRLEMPRGDRAYESVMCLEFSANGALLVAGGAREDSSGFVCTWDMSTRDPMLLPTTFASCVLDVALSADGRYGVSASVDRVEADRSPTRCTYTLWEMPQGQFVREWPTPIDGYATRVMFVPPDNRMIAAATKDGIVFWNVESDEQLPLRTVKADVFDFAISPDGHSLVTVTDFGAQWWDLSTEIPQQREKLTWRRCDAVSFSPDGTLLAARDRDSSMVHIWFRTSRKEMVSLSGGYDTPSDFGIPSLVFSPDSSTVAIGRGTLKIWDLAPWKARRFDGFGEISSILPSVTKEALVVADVGDDSYRTFWMDLPHGTKTDSLGAILALSADGRRFATQSSDGVVHVWEVESGRQLTVLERECCPPVCFSSDGRVIVTNGQDNTIHHVDVTTGERKVLGHYEGRLRDRSHASLGGYPEGPRCLALSPPGNQLVTAAAVEPTRVEVVIWDLATGSRRTLGSFDYEYVGVCFSPRGEYLVVTPMYPETRSGRIRVWNITGIETTSRSEFEGPERIHCFRFSRDGRMLVISGRAAGTLMLFDLREGKQIPLSASTGGWVDSAGFSMDGATLVTASPYGQIKFWNTATGKELGTVNLNEKVGQVYIDANDATLVTASWDGVVRFWPIAKD